MAPQSKNINRERLDYRNAIQFVEASATLGKASDYLTAEGTSIQCHSKRKAS